MRPSRTTSEHPRVCPECHKPLSGRAKFCTFCGTPLTSTPSDWDKPLSERLQNALGSDYSVLAELGRGGFAVVYTVREVAKMRYLAVKVMRPDLVINKNSVERFKRESQIAAQLHHHSILPVMFTGEASGVFYYAMPRVKGETLGQKLDREEVLEPTEAIRVVREVAAGLQYAHQRGVVHRDVKPANIMLEGGTAPRILDFGIAKALAAEGGTLSVTGEVIGSADYMSPEQASGSKSIDHRSDIYSLGIVAYEMLSGRLPFEAENAFAMMANHVVDPPTPLSEHRPDLPASTISAVMKCLSKKPEDRWKSALEAAHALS